MYSDRALALYEELGDLRNQALILNNLGLLAQERSDWDEALDCISGRSTSWNTGDRANACLAKYNIAEILSDQGRLDEAETLLREVIRVWRSQAPTRMSPMQGVNWARCSPKVRAIRRGA